MWCVSSDTSCPGATPSAAAGAVHTGQRSRRPEHLSAVLHRACNSPLCTRLHNRVGHHRIRGGAPARQEGRSATELYEYSVGGLLV